MRKLGLIGGVSWVSTMEYYKRLNQIANQQGSEYSSAELVIVNLNFESILSHQKTGNDEAEFQVLLEAGKNIENSGADKLLICSNTTSNTCDRLADELGIEVVNVIEATLEQIKRMEVTKVGLLGTRYTMERDFYLKRFKDAGINIVVPNESDRNAVHNIIYNELVHNIFNLSSRDKFVEIIENWRDAGVEAAILGCTEIPLLMSNSIEEDMGIKIIDSIDVHINAALEGEDLFRDEGIIQS